MDPLAVSPERWRVQCMNTAPPGETPAAEAGGPEFCDLDEAGNGLQVSFGSPAKGYAEARVFTCKACGFHALITTREGKEDPDELLEP